MSVFQGVKLIARRAGLIQPNGRLQINWNNSLTQNLSTFACVQNGRMINLCRPVDVPTLVNGSTSLPKATNHQWGKGLLFDGTSSLWLPQHNEDRDNFFGGKKTVFAQYIRTATAIDGSTPFCRTANNSIFGNATISYVSANLLLDATNFTTANWSTNSLNPMTLSGNTITVGDGFWNLRQSLSLTSGHNYTISGIFSGANHSLQWVDGNGVATHSGDNASTMTFTATTDFIMIAISNASGSDPGTVTVQSLKLADNTVASTQLGVTFLDDFAGPVQAKATTSHPLRSLETIGGHVAIPAGSASGIFLDGFQSGTAVFDNSSTSVDANSNFIFGGTSDANVQNPFTGIVNFGLYATRSWTDAEMLDFYKAPWQIVKPYPRRTYFDSLIPINTTLSPPDSPEFGFELTSPGMSSGGLQNATAAEFGWETNGPTSLIQQQLIGANSTSAEFGWKGAPPTLNSFLNVIVVGPEFIFELTSPLTSFGGLQNATSAEFGWESNGAPLTQVAAIGANASSLKFAAEIASPTLVQTNNIGANATSAEFGWEALAPPVDFNMPLGVLGAKFGFEMSTPATFRPGEMEPANFKGGWEGTSVALQNFFPSSTPEARTLNIPNGHRIVRINGTFNITKVPITLPMSNPFSVTVYLCSSVILLCSDNSSISIAIG